MNGWKTMIFRLSSVFALTGAILFTVGCKTAPGGINWDSRIGVYTVAQAGGELGKPYRSWNLEDGSQVLEYVSQRSAPWSGGYSGRLGNPTRRPGAATGAGADSKSLSLLTLTFAPSGKLLYWTRSGAQ